MLTRYLANLVWAMSRTTTTGDVSQKISKNMFRIKLSRVSDPTYFMEIINNEHPLSETNRMIDGILHGRTTLNRRNFESIFKKYCYYIEKIPKSSAYAHATLIDKLSFLAAATLLYSRMGHLVTLQMLKAFNRVADQTMAQLSQDLRDGRPGSTHKAIEETVSVLLSVSRYNKKKSFAMLKYSQKYLKSQKCLLNINKQAALYYLQVFKQLKYYNRLIYQMCLDVLKSELLSLPMGDFLSVLYSIGASHLPISQSYASTLMTRITKQLQLRMDSSTGQPSQSSFRQNIRMLESMSLIEVNMKLASCYLPELTKILQLELFPISKYLGKMRDRELKDYSNLLRRACYYDEALLAQLAQQVMQRQIQEFQDLDFQDHDRLQQKPASRKFMSMNTLASFLHAFAIYNYRHPRLIEHFIKTVELVQKKRQLEMNGLKEKADREEKQKIFHPKHYGRVIWSMCVLGTKEEILKIYFLFETFFNGEFSNQFRFYDQLNFYYCYLLLKTYFPIKKVSFEPLLEHLEGQQLEAEISETHENVYSTFISAGIAALKEHNISNIMCDIFVPHYTTGDATYYVSNVIIDIHGYHHFMRNCERLKGGNALKAKILSSEGYIYQYLAVEEWTLAQDKKALICMLMDNIAHKFGRRLTQKPIKDDGLPSARSIATLSSEKNLIEEQGTSSIRIRQGRRIKTNSLRLQDKLKEGKDFSN